MTIALLIAAWYVVGLAGAGFVYAYLASHFRWRTLDERRMRRREASGFSALWAFGGPASAVVGFLVTGFGQYGWYAWRRRRR